MTRWIRQQPPPNLARSIVTPASQIQTISESHASGPIVVRAAAPLPDEDTSSAGDGRTVGAASDTETADRLFPPGRSAEPAAQKNPAVIAGKATMAVSPTHAMAYRASDVRRRHSRNAAAVASATSPPCQTK